MEQRGWAQGQHMTRSNTSRNPEEQPPTPASVWLFSGNALSPAELCGVLRAGRTPATTQILQLFLLSHLPKTRQQYLLHKDATRWKNTPRCYMMPGAQGPKTGTGTTAPEHMQKRPSTFLRQLLPLGFLPCVR